MNVNDEISYRLVYIMIISLAMAHIHGYNRFKIYNLAFIYASSL